MRKPIRLLTTSSVILLMYHKIKVLSSFWLSAVTTAREGDGPTPVLLPGQSRGWRSLVGCSPWGRWESDTPERLHFHFSLSHIVEGNGSPLSVLAWRIPGMGEPGGLPSVGSHRVEHDWSDLAAAAVTTATSDQWVVSRYVPPVGQNINS